MQDTSDQDLYDFLSMAGPDVQDAMIQAGLVPQRMGIAQQGMGIAQGLANTPTPEGRTVGRTYVASSPLEHLSAALRQYQGAKMERQGLGQQQGMVDTVGQGRSAYWNELARQQALIRQQRGAAPPAIPSPPMGAGTGGEF